MRSEAPLEWIRVESLAQVDALVGRYVTGENPVVHWEDSYAHMRFDTAEEALEALREPYFQQFIPANVRTTTVLHEVEEYLPYSSDLKSAWMLVEKVANQRHPVRLWRERDLWMAHFGDLPAVQAPTAPLALSLAALRLRGLDVVIDPSVTIAAAGSNDPSSSQP